MSERKKQRIESFRQGHYAGQGAIRARLLIWAEGLNVAAAETIREHVRGMDLEDPIAPEEPDRG